MIDLEIRIIGCFGSVSQKVYPNLLEVIQEMQQLLIAQQKRIEELEARLLSNLTPPIHVNPLQIGEVICSIPLEDLKPGGKYDPECLPFHGGIYLILFVLYLLCAD